MREKNSVALFPLRFTDYASRITTQENAAGGLFQHPARDILGRHGQIVDKEEKTMRGRALLYPIAVLAITVSGFAIEDPAGYCQLKSHSADFLPRTLNLNAEQSMSDEFVYGLIFGQIHLT